jgi:hypothetical protein
MCAGDHVEKRLTKERRVGYSFRHEQIPYALAD